MRPVPEGKIEVRGQRPAAFDECVIDGAAERAARQPCLGDDAEALGGIGLAELAHRVLRQVDLRGLYPA